jgi:hypothetical protein
MTKSNSEDTFKRSDIFNPYFSFTKENMSRSFFVDSLIVKKPGPQDTQSSLLSSAQITHHERPLMHGLPGYPFHCHPRSQTDLFGVCCPLCIRTPAAGIVPVTASSMSVIKPISTSLASLAATAGQSIQSSYRSPPRPSPITLPTSITPSTQSPPPRERLSDPIRFRYMSLGKSTFISLRYALRLYVLQIRIVGRRKVISDKAQPSAT